MSIPDLTGTWTADDGGVYYIHHKDDLIWWAGFSDDLGFSFTNTFRGRIDALSNRIDGDWIDLPRGLSGNNGRLVLDVVPTSPSTVELRKRFADTTGPFAGNTWVKNTPPHDRGLDKHLYDPRGTGALDHPEPYTDTWTADDGGTYYIRQIDNTVWWVGLSENRGHIFTNVFRGTLIDNSPILQGEWVDVPRGSILSFGQLSLDIFALPSGGYGFRQRPDESTGGFGGMVWKQTGNGLPEFVAISRLLERNQDVLLGAPANSDTQGPDLPHFQLFQEGGNTIMNSVEMHPDGTIYIAYTPSRWPLWYDNYYPNEALEYRNEDIPTADRDGHHNIEEIKVSNVNEDTWFHPEQAFPVDMGPAPRWYTLKLPPSAWVDPCAAERVRLNALEAELNQLLLALQQIPANKCRQVPEVCERAIRAIERWHERHDAEVDRLKQLLASPECQPRLMTDWLSFLRTASPQHINQIVRHETPPLDDPGDYCGNSHVPQGVGALFYDYPEWNTILPLDQLDDGELIVNGQKMHNGQLVTANLVMELMQTDPTTAMRILRFRGHPNKDDTEDRRIPWLPSRLEGIVVNSFLSGEDYSQSHESPPNIFGTVFYWLGVRSPRFSDPSCGGYDTLGLGSENQLCTDWIVYVKADPEYGFLRTKDKDFAGSGGDRGLGNFKEELKGSVENEIEQWLLPVGFRPSPGDRIEMTGRWIVDCGHDNWAGELHPIESYVTTHTERRFGVLGDKQTVSCVVVTGDWEGGIIELDVWPPARPTAVARFRFERDQQANVQSELNIEEILEPPGNNPNHLHLRITASWEGRRTHDWNQVIPSLTKRLATKYRLWWE